MADPLSIAVSVASIVGVGVRISTGLYDICETISSAPDDIEDIASDITSLVVVVDELGKIFAAPGRVYSQKLESSLLNIIKRCRLVFREINRMTEKTIGAEKMKLQSKIAWLFRKTKVQELKASLESLKSTMGLMLQTLRLVKDHRQYYDDERQILGNLLRSQTRSIKVLQDIEKNQERKSRPNRATTSKKQLGRDADPPPTTAEVLSEAIPALPGDEKPGREALQSEGYVIWRSEAVYGRGRIPEHVDVLVNQWTQPLEQSAESTGSLANVPNKSFWGKLVYDDEYNSEAKIIHEEHSHLDRLEGEEKASRDKDEERIRKIENRLKKRENGWLEIDDKALARLREETVALRKSLASKNSILQSYISRREQLDVRCKSAIENYNARCKAKEGQEKKLSQSGPLPSYRTASYNDYGNFTERRNLLGIDSDSDSETDSESGTEANHLENEAIYELPAHIPDKKGLPLRMPNEKDFQPTRKSSGRSKPVNANRHSSLPSHFRRESSASLASSEPKTTTSPKTAGGSPPQSPRPSILSLGSTSSIASAEVIAGPGPKAPGNHPSSSQSGSCNSFADNPPQLSNPACNRQAWKPPQPFLEGFNTFADVLGTAKHSFLWFKASQDSYAFYLGAQKSSFYTLHLVPADLSTYDTSRVEWTVIEKLWATPKTLRAMNLPYLEDTVGFVWIRKELNWHQIKQLFDFSCSLLDNALNESARDIMRKRSEDVKKLSSFEKSFIAIRRDEKKARSQLIYHQHHVFFHEPQQPERSRFFGSTS